MTPLRLDRARSTGQPATAQRGAATLIVVMVLFFVMSMVAAYTSRNLIFEQKTSGNQVRSTQASEAAEAGLRWALGLLNSGRIDTTCQPTANLALTTFRDRYLTINATDGAVTPKTKADGTALLPSCVFNGLTWNCSCPNNGDPAVAVPVGTAAFPAFRVQFRPHASRPMVVHVDVNGCTAYIENCLNFVGGQGSDNEGRITVSAMVTLKGAISSAPVGALTARTTVNLAGSPLRIANSNPKASGITVHAGSTVTQAGLLLTTIPGSPVAQSVIELDSSLSTLTADSMFVTTFGMRRTTYRDQPGTVLLTCAGACTATQVRDAVDLNPGRIIWVAGNLDIDSAGDIGTPAAPVAIVATGSVQFSNPVTVYGLVYSQAATWLTTGLGTITGAAMGEGAVAGTSAGIVAYDADILDNLRYRTGSFVLIPGSWKDY